MYLLETIHIVDGKALHLSYHQQRIEEAQKQLNLSPSIHLQLNPPKTGEFRCRIIYEQDIIDISYHPYQLTLPHSFKLIHADIDYALKYEDRSQINRLLEKKGDTDEIIIIKNGLVTDTSIANLAFLDEDTWITPKHPLLAGTTRQRLIDCGKIIPKDISYKTIKNFSKIAVMNALTDFQIIEDAIIS